jgi:hypothetical protein
MTILCQGEPHHLELAFESSYPIVKLSGLEGNEELIELRKRVIAGELGFDGAVRIVIKTIAVRSP